MIDLNVRALTELSLAFVDSLARHHGGLLNVGSMAGFLPGPGMAVYYATKAYVLSFTEALHSELKPRGIRVTVLVPGSGADGIRRTRRRQRWQSGAEHPHPVGGLCGGSGLSRPDGRPPDDRARASLNKLITVLIRLIPRRMLLAVVDSRQTPAQVRAADIAASRRSYLQTPVERLVVSNARARAESPC